MTYDVEGVLDWRLVVQWSEEVVFNREDNTLLQQFVAHQELLACTRDVPVSVLNSHTSESSLLHLKGHQSSQVETNLSFLGWMNTWVSSGSENVEALVSDLKDHCFTN